jgi:hypothetical protein
MLPLDEEVVGTSLNAYTMQVIRQNLWPVSTVEHTGSHNLDWEPYSKYYQDQCNRALHEQGANILVRTHQHVVDIASKLKDGESRDTIKDSLRGLTTTIPKWQDEDEALDNTIDLAARLCFMVNIGANASTVTRCEKLLWTDSSLKDYLETYFSEPHVLSHDSVCFNRALTAFNMERVAGIKIYWTDNLADHLRVVNDDHKKVAIFHHASFLERARQTSQFPAGLVEETLRTLALLFPREDKHTKRWLQTICPSSKVDSHLMNCQRLRLDHRQIERFIFWHDRLIILKEVFDESRPTRLSQWWYDRRDGHVWYTFWVAVFVLLLTVLFGLIQSIEGALQVYKAYHATT